MMDKAARDSLLVEGLAAIDDVVAKVYDIAFARGVEQGVRQERARIMAACEAESAKDEEPLQFHRSQPDQKPVEEPVEAHEAPVPPAHAPESNSAIPSHLMVRINAASESRAKVLKAIRTLYLRDNNERRTFKEIGVEAGVKNCGHHIYELQKRGEIKDKYNSPGCPFWVPADLWVEPPPRPTMPVVAVERPMPDRTEHFQGPVKVVDQRPRPRLLTNETDHHARDVAAELMGDPKPGRSAADNPLVAKSYLRTKGHVCAESGAGLIVDGKLYDPSEILDLVNSHRARADLPALESIALA